MGFPLFIHQSICRERKLCHTCRDSKVSVYRTTWANWYTMPPEWPECPFGVPWDVGEIGRPVEPHLLGIAADDPDCDEAKAVMKRVEERADLFREVCIHCPGKHFKGITEDGLQVDCEVAFSCCGGKLSRGFVHLGVNECQKEYWRENLHLRQVRETTGREGTAEVGAGSLRGEPVGNSSEPNSWTGVRQDKREGP